MPTSFPFVLISSAPPHYGRDGPGFETRWGIDFPDPSTPAPSSTQSTVLFPGGKAADGVEYG